RAGAPSAARSPRRSARSARRRSIAAWMRHSSKTPKETARFSGAEELGNGGTNGVRVWLIAVDTGARMCYPHNMRLKIHLKLLPTPQQADALKRTLETANAACNYISQVAWGARTFGQFT